MNKKEFDKIYDELVDKREDTIHKLVDIQLSIHEHFDNYDKVFGKKKK